MAGEARRLVWSFEGRPGYLFARVSGEFSLPSILALIDALAAELKESGDSRMFVDVSAVLGDPSDLDRYEYGVHAARMLGDVERFAVLGRKDMRVNQFFEDVARNRGLPVRVFIDADASRDWISAP